MSRFARRVDLTHEAIREELRQIGATVVDISRLGDSWPDLLVGFRGRSLLVECKTPGRGETYGQTMRRRTWTGDAWLIAHSPEEAVRKLVEVVA